jgi:hypothetical protein
MARRQITHGCAPKALYAGVEAIMPRKATEKAHTATRSC